MDLLNKTENQSLTLSDFLATARDAVENNLPPCWIAGEVTNFARAASGHCYFVLRDTTAQADCVILKQFNALLATPLQEGDAVEVLAQASIYTPRGRFQLMVRFARHTGAGRLYQLYAERKQTWAAKGWFNAADKKTPPFLPTVVGVVGSVQGAAVRDVLRVLKTRMPSVHVIVYPAPAQGADAADKIAAAIAVANRRRETEVLIVCRGGGGIEDLWAYNEEAVVAAIVESRLPIICGIGHEIDETLADFAADLRAPTPTAAAVAATPDNKDLRLRLTAVGDEIKRAARRYLTVVAQRLDWATNAMVRPQSFMQNKNARLREITVALIHAADTDCAAMKQRLQIAAAQLRRPPLSAPLISLAAATKRLPLAATQCLQKSELRFHRAAAMIRACNPKQTLARGYSIVRHRGDIIRDGDNLIDGNRLHLTFARGEATAIVEDTAADFNKIIKPTDKI